ncbi:MAG: arsinothricin resistance N-acetyltransferase ArsN1 family B [Rubrivivax sp.]
MQIRTATPDDAAAILAIYAPVVRDTPVSFETEAPSVDTMRSRIAQTLRRFPWLVGLDGAGQVCGYVYAGPYAERAAYRWSVTVTVYVHAGCRRDGVGRRLYAALLQQLQDLGYCQAYAGITLPNAGSVGLHEAMGFSRVGVFHNAGHKLGRWHDVGWWQRTLQQPDPPPEPRAFTASA